MIGLLSSSQDGFCLFKVVGSGFWIVGCNVSIAGAMTAMKQVEVEVEEFAKFLLTR